MSFHETRIVETARLQEVLHFVQPNMWRRTTFKTMESKIKKNDYKIGPTRQIWTVNSTPSPTDTIRITAGTALSFIPMRPMKPNSSITITNKTPTWNTKSNSIKTSEINFCSVEVNIIKYTYGALDLFFVYYV